MRSFWSLIAAFATMGVAPALAQGGPDTLVNVQVLSKDMSRREVMNFMRGVTRGLGVRCEYCHIGEPGQPLRTFDFVSDEKPTKLKAREMLRMVMAINEEHLTGLDDRADPPIEVNCATCHRGLNRPATLAYEMVRVYGEEGIDAAVTHYRTLRERYYGSWSYDFGEASLSQVAQEMMRDDDWDGALAMLNLNKEFFPESAAIFTNLGQAYMEKGDDEAAVQNLERALELQPRNRMARRLLREIGNDGL